MKIVLLSIAVGIPTGLAGMAIGHYWDKFVTSKGWAGWHMPSYTDFEREEMGL